MLQFFCAGTYHLRKMGDSYNILLVCGENKLLNSLHEGRTYHVPAATTILCTFYFVVPDSFLFKKIKEVQMRSLFSRSCLTACDMI